MTIPTMTPTTKSAIALIVVLLGLLPAPVQAQQGVLLDTPGQWFTSAGAVCNGCLLNAYIAGTTTRLDTYSDAALSTPNANPVVLDSAGRATVFLGDRAYKFVLTTSGGTEIWTRDNVVGRVAPSNLLTKTANYTVLTSDGKDVVIACDASGGAVTITLYTAVGNSGRRIAVKKTDASANACVLDGNAAETIDGAATLSLGTQYQDAMITSNGTNWLRFGSDIATQYVRGCTCRLTLTSGTPVTTSDVTAAGTIYLTPYGGNVVVLYDGSSWVASNFTELSLSLAGHAADTNFDVFVYNNSGTLTLTTTAWTNATTRATAIVLLNGSYVKSGTSTQLYVGTIRTNSAGAQTEDSAAKAFVYNMFNRVVRPRRVLEATNTWTYNGGWRQANGSTANQIAFVAGLSEDTLDVTAVGAGSNSNGAAHYVGIGLDATNAKAAESQTGIIQGDTAATGVGSATAIYRAMPAIGYHYVAWLEASDNSTQTWNGDNGSTIIQTGISMTWRH